MRRGALFTAVVAVVAVAGLVVWDGRADDGPPTTLPAVDPAWDPLGPQQRCERALDLVSHPDRWPIRCRWREPGEGLAGQSFPPPAGAPPYDEPRVEIYVARQQPMEDVARTIAHELGHMHHTREPTFVAQWLQARNLPPDTPSEVWTEDYAEVFAALFGPPNDRWRAPTPRPGAEALAGLKARFFS